MASSQDETFIKTIKEQCKVRWLRPIEVQYILVNYKKLNLEVLLSPVHEPESGRFYLFDKKVCRFFRKDKHSWQKKRDGKTVKESHEKLKVGSTEVLHCYYATGKDNERFQRRSYWLLDEERIVLVHYLEKPQAGERQTTAINMFIPGTEMKGDLTETAAAGLTMPQTPDVTGTFLHGADGHQVPFDETNISDVDSDGDIEDLEHLAISPRPVQQQHGSEMYPFWHPEANDPAHPGHYIAGAPPAYTFKDMLAGAGTATTFVGPDHPSQPQRDQISSFQVLTTSVAWRPGGEGRSEKVTDCHRQQIQPDAWRDHSQLECHEVGDLPPLQRDRQQCEEEKAGAKCWSGAESDENVVWPTSESEERLGQKNEGQPLPWHDRMHGCQYTRDECFTVDWGSSIPSLPLDHEDNKFRTPASHLTEIAVADRVHTPPLGEHSGLESLGLSNGDGVEQGIDWLISDGLDDGILDSPSESTILSGSQDTYKDLSEASYDQRAVSHEAREEGSSLQSSSRPALSSPPHHLLNAVVGMASHHSWDTRSQYLQVEDIDSRKRPASGMLAQGAAGGSSTGPHQHCVHHHQQPPQLCGQLKQPSLEQTSTSDVLGDASSTAYQLNLQKSQLLSASVQEQQQQQNPTPPPSRLQQQDQQRQQQQYQQLQHQQQHQQQYQRQYEHQQQQQYQQQQLLHLQEQQMWQLQQHLAVQPSSQASQTSQDEQGSDGEDPFTDELDSLESFLPTPTLHVEVPHPSRVWPHEDRHGKPQFSECRRVIHDSIMEGKEKEGAFQRASFVRGAVPEKIGIVHSPMESTASVSASSTPVPRDFARVIDGMRRDAARTGMDDEVDRQLTERLDRLLLTEDATSSMSFSKLAISPHGGYYRFIIEDFAPQWVFTKDQQAKVIVIGHVQDRSVRSWFCKFGDVEVKADMVRDGILRCRPPVRDKEERVLFCITCGDGSCCSNVKLFDYRGREAGAENITHMGLLIRFVKAVLSDEVDNQIADEAVRTGEDRSPGPLGEWEWLVREEQTLTCVQEHLLQMLLKRRLSGWLHKHCQMSYQGQQGNLTNAIDRLDNTGMGVVHLAAALGYDWAIAILRAAHASLDSFDFCGRTALHWAAAFGRELTVSTLLAAGASPGILLRDIWTAAELADMAGNPAIAALLSLRTLEQSKDMLSSKVSTADISTSIEAHEAGHNAVDRATLYASAESPHEYQDSLPQDLDEAKTAVYRAAQAASLIQAVYRQYYARKKEREWEVRKMFAARKIQKAYRGFQKTKLKKRTEAATKIQKVYRGWRRRREFLQKRKKIIKIQALWRGKMQRRRYSKMRNALKVIEVAVKRWRNHKKLLVAAQEEKDKESLMSNRPGEQWRNVGGVHHPAPLEQAVIRVQALVRSKQAQRAYCKMREEYQAQKAQYDAQAAFLSHEAHQPFTIPDYHLHRFHY